MSHVRQQLRSQIVVALLGQTSAVNNVFTNKMMAIDATAGEFMFGIFIEPNFKLK